VISVKIGIITFWWANNNYGQLLQCYALQKYLLDAGHDVYLIRYNPNTDSRKTSTFHKIKSALNPYKLYKYFILKMSVLKEKKEEKRHPHSFDDFRKTYIKQSPRIYNSYEELVKDPPEADMYIVGSDQVWNFNWWGNTLEKVKGRIGAYLLNFGDKKIQRVAYAASFGKEKIDKQLIQAITPLMKNFSYVSVREKSGLEICRECGIDNAEWVPDPVMLLDVNQYRALYKDILLEDVESPYCLMYIGNNYSKKLIRALFDWAKKKRLHIVFINMYGFYKKQTKTFG
jgi:hypothetical protein